MSIFINTIKHLQKSISVLIVLYRYLDLKYVKKLCRCRFLIAICHLTSATMTKSPCSGYSICHQAITSAITLVAVSSKTNVV